MRNAEVGISMIRALRDLLARARKPSVRRSSQWPALRKRWLAEHPKCEGCGRTDELEVHHKVPVHVRPTRELDETNLMTLCQHPTWNCHLIIGHCGDWHDYRQQ